MKSFKPFDFKFVFVLLILMAEDSVPKVSDMGDIGDQNYLPGGGETDTRGHTFLPLHADQGANFESKVIRALCQLLRVEKSRTTPFHPMGNGSCERMNQTLISMLGTLPGRRKKDWTPYIGMLVLAYNSTKCDSTGFSPYFLMFGREPRLPVDNMFPLCSEP